MPRLFFTVSTTRSLENEIIAAWEGEGWHAGLRAAFFLETPSSTRQPNSVAAKKQDNASSARFIVYAIPSVLAIYPIGICNSRLHFAPRYGISLGYYTVGLLQGCLSTAACSHKTKNGTTHTSALNKHKGSSFIQMISLNIWIHWSLLLHQHEVSLQTIDLTFNNQYFPSTCSAFKVICWTD